MQMGAMNEPHRVYSTFDCTLCDQIGICTDIEGLYRYKSAGHLDTNQYLLIMATKFLTDEVEQPVILSVVEGTGGNIVAREPRPWMGAIGWFNEGMVNGSEHSQWEVPGRRFKLDAPPNAKGLPTVERLALNQSTSGLGKGPKVVLILDSIEQSWKMSRPMHVYRPTANGEINTKSITSITVDRVGNICSCVIGLEGIVVRWRGRMKECNVIVEAADVEWGELVVSLLAAAGDRDARLIVEMNKSGVRTTTNPWTGELISLVVGDGLGETSFYGSPRLPEIWQSGLEVVKNMTANTFQLADRTVLRLADLGAASAPDANTAVSTQWLMSSRDFDEPTRSEEMWVVEEVQKDFWSQEVEILPQNPDVPWEWEPSILRRFDDQAITPTSVPAKLYDIELRKVVPGAESTPGARYITLSYVWTQ